MIKNEQIKEKANYCLNCKVKPCSNKGCPLNNDIPTFIKLVKEEKYEEAYYVLTKTTILPSICGRICPHEKQCQGSCVRGIKGEPVSIGDIEAFIGDMAIENGWKIPKIYDKDEVLESNKIENNDNLENCDISEKINNNCENKKVAIVGGGPAGLTAAAFLARKGAKVTIYEKYNYLGGLLIHGIPEFRLPKEIVKKSIDKILDLGIDVKYNQSLGKNLNLIDLEKDYDAIILASGANISSKMGIDGENLKGVYGGNELLEHKMHPDYNGKIVIVNGGGNVAMDTARTIKRLGARKVIVTYRRAREQMPAEKKEIEDAINEGIEFLFQNNIVKIIGNENNEVFKIELIKTELVQKEGDTRLSPVNIEGSNYELDCNYVVMALGSHAEDFVGNLGLKLNQRGNIEVDEFGRTSNPKIYAIGDLAGNKSTVAWAARSGRNVAESVEF